MFAPHLKPFGNEKTGKQKEKKINESCKIRKKQIQYLLKNKMGLLVNNVEAGSSKMSNDGTTGRRFLLKITVNLLELQVSSDITSVVRHYRCRQTLQVSSDISGVIRNFRCHQTLHVSSDTLSSGFM